MGPKTAEQKKMATMQEAKKDGSPDWLADGGIHSAANPIPGRANTEFDQKRLMLAVVAHKMGSKTPGPPEMAEREKSPITADETAKATNSPAQKAIRHALPEEKSLTGVSLETMEMETSPASALSGAAEGERVLTSDEVPATKLQYNVVLPRTRSKLVWGLLSSLCRDINTNPASSPHGAGEESQTDQFGRPGRNALPEGEAFDRCSDMLQLAGKRLTTLLVKTSKIQLRINSLKRNLADGLLPPGLAPKLIPFGEVTEDMQARWRALDNSFWKQSTELAVVFETENSERANQEVESHLEGTTKLLKEAHCSPLGLTKLAVAWDKAQEESVKLAQHQLETGGTRKRGEGKLGTVIKHTARHSPFQSRPKGGYGRQRKRCGTLPAKAKARRKSQKAKATRKSQKAEARAGEEELQTSSSLNLCANHVFCNCPMCCKRINLAPLNLGRLIRACKEGAKEYKTSGKFLCNLSDFTLCAYSVKG